ncbi:MAG TPA: PAS domain S-box protein [Syntrophorhabdaceae bacterium]|nr:PAS domain S-box protein [Syntrophorhabdaceae bacterium]
MIHSLTLLTTKRIQITSISVLIFLFIVTGCLFAETAPAQASKDINKKIRVVIDNNYPPYVFLDSHGNLQGILIDQWRLWEKKTGVHVDIQGMDWGEAQRRMEAGEFDVIDTIFFTERRAKIYDYSKPYAKIDVSIFFHKDISGINDVHSLHGFLVAVKSGDAAIDYLKSKGITSLQEFPSYEAIIKAAKERKVMITVIDKPPALYFLYKMGILDQFRYSAPLYTGEFHRAVKKGNAALLQLVEEGFKKISENEYQAINRKWFGTEPVFFITFFRYIAIVAGVLIVIALSLVTWNYTLRKKVRERTMELEKEIALVTEVTEKLRESEEKYRTIFENAIVGIFQTTPEGRLITVNPTCARIFGYESPEEMIASVYPISEQLYKDSKDREQWRKHIEQEGMVRDIEVQGKRKNGAPFWFRLNARTITDDKGRIILFEGMVEDITEQKKIEQTLQAEQSLSNSILESMPGVFYFFDDQLRFIKWNKNLEKVTGYSTDEISKMSPLDLFEGDDRKFVVDKIREVFEKGESSFEASFTSKDNNKILYFFTGKRIFINNTQCLVGMGIDITEKKKTEKNLQEITQLLQTTIDASPLGIIAVDNNDRVTIWNPAAERMFGWKKKEVIGLPLPIVPDDRKEEFEKIRVITNKKEPFQLERSQRKKKDGSLIDVSLSVAPLTDNQGNIIGRMGIFADITERVKTDEKIRISHQQLQAALDIANKSRQALLSVIEDQKKAQEEILRLNEELEERVRKRTIELEASNKELEAFTYSVSHDLKAPLRAIEGFTRILVEDYEAQLDAEGKRICSVIVDNTRYMGELIEDLLTLSRTGRIKMHLLPIDMKQMAYSVFSELTTFEEKKRIDFHVGDLPQATGDPTLIKQVFMNLIGNAIKFSSKRKKAIIEIKGEESEEEVVYSVQDNGIGFDMRYIDKIFGLFQRLHGRDEFKGTGVGLAIVERIIHRHGGRVWAEGEEGKGATFWFALPKKGYKSLL